MGASLRSLPIRPPRPAFTKGRVPRAINVALGLWLVASGVLFAQTSGARLASFFVGFTIALLAILSAWYDAFRYANTVLAVWLAFSPGAIFGMSGPASWNAIVVSILVFFFSLMPNRETEAAAGGRGRRA
jgi:hypothetical protein